MSGGLSFLDVLGEDLVVLGSELLGFLEALKLGLLIKLLSSESLLGDESLDLGALVESLVALLDFTADNILSDIVLFAESEDLSDVGSSLGAESTGLDVGSHTFDISITLLHDLESDDGQIGTADAATD